MSEEQSVVCPDSENRKSEEVDESVEEAALREDIEVVALREGVGEAKRKREDQVGAGDNFCV